MTDHYQELIESLQRDLTEEVKNIRVLVEDEDSSCPSRNLRQERLDAFQFVIRLLDVYKTWEW